MNQTLYSIMLVYCISSVIYLLYVIYVKYKNQSFESELKDNPELLKKYKDIKKTRTIIFIIGLLVGFCFIILFDNKPLHNLNINVDSINDIKVKY